ncbi:helix-turn-helix domain-containing protein [Longimicrobium sp.]|uniref:TetR/AcrR family transcriptional regulator n=1 Tax=Longimicrobium sp. TaxID=2029185 RepID=UPI002E315256|nr:helix-turn-helix domain-containing protein [Longimicrobium sp.]HEX6037986.1 helix-turn-helix domain-containing protein [Longimicrobium sp.]
MSPRTYNSSRRRESAEATRERIVMAAHGLLAEPAGVSAFTVEAVARRAGVARMTVYNQFGSKAALLEALFDLMVRRGGIDQGMPKVFRVGDPLDAFAVMFDVLARYYSTDRTVKRRVHALAALQPDVARALGLREDRRRRGIRTLLGRMGRPWPPARLDDLEQLVFTLTSFESFDTLAGPYRAFPDVAPLLAATVRAVLSAE